MQRPIGVVARLPGVREIKNLRMVDPSVARRYKAVVGANSLSPPDLKAYWRSRTLLGFFCPVYDMHLVRSHPFPAIAIGPSGVLTGELGGLFFRRMVKTQEYSLDQVFIEPDFDYGRVVIRAGAERFWTDGPQAGVIAYWLDR